MILISLHAQLFHRYRPGIPVIASTGVVAVFTRAKTAENTANKMAKQTQPIVATHKP